MTECRHCHADAREGSDLCGAHYFMYRTPFEPKTTDPRDAELASLRAENARLVRDLDFARKAGRKRADGEANALGVVDSLRAEVERLKARPVGVPRAALALVVDTLVCAINPDERRAVDEVRAWLASLPGGDKEPNRFCACGRRTSECDRSRTACISESR